MSGYFCIGFIDVIRKDKSFLDYTNLFPPNECEKNHKIVLEYFQHFKTIFFMNRF